jgi:hypothetical protein
VSQLSSGPVHRMRSVFSGYQEGAAIFASISPEGWIKFGWRSRLVLDPKRIRTQKPYASL